MKGIATEQAAAAGMSHPVPGIMTTLMTCTAMTRTPKRPALMPRPASTTMATAIRMTMATPTIILGMIILGTTIPDTITMLMMMETTALP